ncbi:hypothetical protein K474DRAFT_1078186 [Panus rudis PR-1116 ss-1]|nr:hypothetical protein K474DRAFT_1078186 [Panus rudis PR-1116 ss-1]
MATLYLSVSASVLVGFTIVLYRHQMPSLAIEPPQCGHVVIHPRCEFAHKYVRLKNLAHAAAIERRRNPLRAVPYVLTLPAPHSPLWWGAREHEAPFRYFDALLFLQVLYLYCTC